MTAYGKPRQQPTNQLPIWKRKKAERKEVLAGVRARRREIYTRIRAKRIVSETDDG